MSSNNPIGDQPKDPLEAYKIRLEIIERNKRGPDDRGEPPEKKPSLLVKFLELIKTTLDYILNLTEQRSSKNAEGKTRENLIKLNIFFDVLKKEDRSQDAHFLNRLSKLWHKILEDSLQLKRGSSISKPFRNFLVDLQNYPPGDEHSFAYYLTESIDQQWLPFPYMDLIQQIHTDHTRNPQSSALTRWTGQIDHLLEILMIPEQDPNL